MERDRLSREDQPVWGSGRTLAVSVLLVFLLEDAKPASYTGIMGTTCVTPEKPPHTTTLTQATLSPCIDTSN